PTRPGRCGLAPSASWSSPASRQRASRRRPSRAAPRSTCSCLLARPGMARAYKKTQQTRHPRRSAAASRQCRAGARRTSIRHARARGNGTTRMTATTAGTQAEGAAASPTQPAGARILIVEDDFGIASNLETFLSLRGFAVDAVYSGQAALHRCSVDRFDVILLDVGLPGLDGLTFLRRLRDELRAATPVLILSARTELADKLAGFAHGA